MKAQEDYPATESHGKEGLEDYIVLLPDYATNKQ